MISANVYKYILGISSGSLIEQTGPLLSGQTESAAISLAVQPSQMGEKPPSRQDFLMCGAETGLPVSQKPNVLYPKGFALPWNTFCLFV